jgi:hypothetical protein
MPIFTEPEEPEFASLEARDSWFVSVMLAEYGELEGVASDIEMPAELDWLLATPLARRYDFEEAECGLAFYADDSDYCCTVWDVTGDGDDPWAVFLVDIYGARLLSEYSLFDEEATDEERDEVLGRAAIEIPARAERGELFRSGTPVTIPEWLKPGA